MINSSGDDVFVGVLECDVLLGAVDSLKHKRAIIRPVLARLRRFKDDATEVREGFECGIGLGSWNNIEVEDTIETYDVREKPRS